MMRLLAHISQEQSRAMAIALLLLAVAAITVVVALVWAAMWLYRRRTRDPLKRRDREEDGGE